MTDSSNLNDRLRHGIELARTGQKRAARAIFEAVIQQDETNELAWLWMTAVVETTAERREALEIVLEINPQNKKARTALDRMGGPRARQKAEAAQQLAERLGFEEIPTEADFQPRVRPAPTPEPEAPPEPTPTQREQQTTQALLQTARQGNSSSRNDDTDGYDFSEEDRARQVTVIRRVLLPMLGVIIGVAMVAAALWGIISNQPLPPTNAPTYAPPVTAIVTLTPASAMEETRLASLPTGTPTFTAEPSATPTATASPLPPVNHQIIFTQQQNEQSAFVLALVSISEEVQSITGPLANSFAPAVASGRFVAYVTDTANGQDIAVLDLSTMPSGDGPMIGDVVTTLGARYANAPSWAPDGYRFVFEAFLNDEWNIFLSNAEGTVMVQLTDTDGINNRAPAWSPDGQRIAFTSHQAEDNTVALYTMLPNGNNVTPVITQQGIPSSPAWSPDSRYMVYAVDRGDGSGTDLYITDLNGSETQVTDHIANDQSPAWSPDGQWIAFASDRTGTTQIYITALDGSQLYPVTNLTNGEALDPTWYR